MARSWADRSAKMARQIRDSSLCQVVTYTPSGGSAQSIRANFEQQTSEVVLDGEMAIRSESLAIVISATDVTGGDPGRNDTVTIGSTTYRVTEAALVEGQHRVRLLLRRA